MFVGRGGDGSFRRLRHRLCPLVVAGHRDTLLRIDKRRPVVLIEHGSGQSYGGDPNPHVARHRCYAGGTGRAAAMFLHPNEHAAGRDRAAYPDARVEVVGPLRHAQLATIPRHAPADRPVLAFTFHWDCHACPETRTSWHVFASAIAEAVASDRFADVVATAHPRLWTLVRSEFARLGARPVESFAGVLAEADVLAADNTTAMFDWAALRGPTVVLNPPFYRRDVDHGLRFWSAAGIGPNVDAPGDVCDAALEAAAGPWPGADAALAQVWAPVDDPAQAAVDAVLSLL